MAKPSKPRAPKGVSDERERISVPMDTHYKDNDFMEIQRHFGMNAGQLGLHAIKELWRRRNEAEDLGAAYARIGLKGIIEDLRHYNFTNMIANADSLSICVDDFSYFFSSHDHLKTILDRLSSETKITTVILPTYSADNSATNFEIFKTQRFMADKLINSFRAIAEISPHGNFALVEKKYPMGLPALNFVSDQVSISSYPSMPEWTENRISFRESLVKHGMMFASGVEDSAYYDYQLHKITNAARHAETLLVVTKAHDLTENYLP